MLAEPLLLLIDLMGDIPNRFFPAVSRRILEQKVPQDREIVISAQLLLEAIQAAQALRHRASLSRGKQLGLVEEVFHVLAPLMEVFVAP